MNTLSIALIGDYNDQSFLTAGGTYTTGTLSLTLTLIDSHLFNNAGFEKTYGSLWEQFHRTSVSMGIGCIF